VREHALLSALVVFGLACPTTIRAQDQSVEEQIVDAMNKAFGVHPGFRANHAKGIVVEGSFKASPEAAGLSRAVLFNGSTIPVTVRFSDSTGIPNLPDGSKAANPHGMAIKFHLPDGRDTDMVINSLKFFPVSTGEDFRDLLLALAASLPDAAKPTKFEQFAASHPSAPAALATAATPDSFADEESELNPVSLYAETKVAAEEAISGVDGSIATCCLRFATVFGTSPRMRFDLTVNEFTRDVAVKGELLVYGEQFWRPYVHVRDAARAIALVLDAPAEAVKSSVFNVGDESQNYRKLDLTELLRERFPAAEISFVHRDEDPRDYRVSFSRVREQLAFGTEHAVADGIDEVVALLDSGLIRDPYAAIYKN
jgi:nucleoside-diphosphate-sugar epimerase